MFRIFIYIDNAAFEPSASDELARILRVLADELRNRTDLDILNGIPLRDLNGNIVGRAQGGELER